MYSSFKLARKYLRYYFTSSNGKGHGIHSPFVFDFVKKILNDTNRYPQYQRVEDLRNRLLADDRKLNIVDLGAGSKKSPGTQRSIGEIARHAAKPEKYGKLLFRMARFYQPDNIIELGTSLGITTAYLALGSPSASTTSIEGSPEIAEAAKQNFSELGLGDIKLVTGNFDIQLDPVLENLSGNLLVFIDGNHRKQPTLDYFNRVLPKIKPGSIIIFDDIHWSMEMEEAWEIIRQHPAVKLSIDLFFIGIVFFRDDFLVKQEFVIRF